MRSFNVFQRAAATGMVAGQRARIELDASRDTRYLFLTLSCRVAISVANATSIRNLGSPFAILDMLGLLEGGSVTGQGDPRAFAFASEFLRISAGTHTRLTSPNIATTTITERCVIPFERLYSMVPHETRYRVRNPAAKFDLFVDVNATPAAKLLVVGGATVVVDQINLEVQQYVAEPGANLPQFAPRWSEQTITVPGTNAKLAQEIEIAGDWIRGITIIQETAAGGLASDIINRAQLRADRKVIIGEDGPVSWSQLAAALEHESGGNVFAANGGSIVHLDFQQGGRLSNILSPFDGDNLRFVWDVQVSAGGSGSSQIKLLLHRLSRDEEVGTAGRRVIDPELRIPA
jgi:hypothetical protein